MCMHTYICQQASKVSRTTLNMIVHRLRILYWENPQAYAHPFAFPYMQISSKRAALRKLTSWLPERGSATV